MNTVLTSILTNSANHHRISVIEERISLCPPNIEVSVAETSTEIEASFEIRKSVFVQEQGLYHGSDKDKYDDQAIAIIAKVDGNIVGTVRCYRKSGRTWFGGRLAVLKEYRKYNLGAALVRKAVETMENRSDVDKFMASVQIQNVKFFRRLGWQTLGVRFMLRGIKHWMMQKQLTE